MTDEPILRESKNRYTLFPIEHQDIYDMYKRHVDSFWRAEEVDFSKDLNHWNNLDDNTIKAITGLSLEEIKQLRNNKI